MKHKLRAWIATLLALCLCLSFAGCADVGISGEGGSGTTPHTHTFAAEWSHDEEKHWHAATCGHDTQRGDEAAHTYVNGKCTECQYEHASHAFEYSNKTETEHTGTCSVCGKVVTEAHNYENGVCTECHFMHKNHTYGDDNTCSTCGKKLYTKSADSKKVYFGEYPQTEVTDANDSDKSLRNSLNMIAGDVPAEDSPGKWTDYGYYSYGAVSEYMWYIDMEYQGSRYRGVYFTKYRPEKTTHGSSYQGTFSYQDDNGYDLYTAYWFQYEPIEWRILEQKDGTALLMANIILDSQQYYHTFGTRTIDGETVYPNNYKESDIRAWLNGTFYETAFDEYAQEIIETTTVDNSAASTGSTTNPYVCENTQDKVFLLSYKDVLNTSYGFSSSSSTDDTARQLKSTDYAKSQGCWQEKKSSYRGNGRWWLRSPESVDDGNGRYIYSDGHSNWFAYVTCDEAGVVPALRIRL